MGGRDRRLVAQTNPSSTPSNSVTHNDQTYFNPTKTEPSMCHPSTTWQSNQDNPSMHPSRNLPSRNSPSRNLLPPNKYPGGPHPPSAVHLLPSHRPNPTWLTFDISRGRETPPARPAEPEEVRPSVSTVPSRVGLGTPRVRYHTTLRPRSHIGRPHQGIYHLVPA